MTSKSILRAAVAVAALSAAPQAQALTFVLTDTGGTAAGTQARAGFQAAANYWSSVFTDNVTVNLNIGYQTLGANILGSTGSTLYSTTVNSFYSALTADRTVIAGTPTVDSVAVANLPTRTGGAITVTTPGYVDAATKTGLDTTTSVVDSDGSANNSRLIGTSANLKALGFGLPAGSDGSIVFNSLINFDFNPTDGIASGYSDFIGVAIHEIGHALGFISGVDTYDYYGCPNGTGCQAGKSINFNTGAVGTVLDLFRYSSADTLDWRPGVESYFSIDRGATELFGNSNFSTGVQNGDHFQASHWKAPTNAAGQNTCSNLIGIMNPYLCDSTQGVVTASDIAAFDAIGWNVNFNALANPGYRFTSADAYLLTPPVPEPATWAMMIAGFGLVGASMRRRTSVRFAAA